MTALSTPDKVSFHTLHFFGRMNVHLTHDMKNVMATISETTGLLGDLLDMYAAGGNVDRKRLNGLCDRVTAQVDRAQDLLRRMNSFAHTVDDESRNQNVMRLLELMLDLAKCMPFYREITLTAGDPGPGEMAMQPYHLEHLLYGCFTAAFKGLEPEAGLAMEASRNGGALVLRLTGLANGAGDEPEDFPGPATRAAADALQAELQLDRTAGLLEIRIPAQA